MGSDEWMHRAVWGEPSGSGDRLLILIEGNEDISQDGIVPEVP